MTNGWTALGNWLLPVSGGLSAAQTHALSPHSILPSMANQCSVPSTIHLPRVGHQPSLTATFPVTKKVPSGCRTWQRAACPLCPGRSFTKEQTGCPARPWPRPVLSITALSEAIPQLQSSQDKQACCQVSESQACFPRPLPWVCMGRPVRTICSPRG